MDVRIVGVPVIDPHPIQPRSKVVLHLPDEIAGEGSKVRHLGCVLGTDDEPEMMPVITGALGEATQIGIVRGGVEHPGRRAVFGAASHRSRPASPSDRRSAPPLCGHALIARAPHGRAYQPFQCR